MNNRLRDERRVAEEAAAWLETLKTGGAEARTAFAAWIKESPRHVQDFLLMTALDAELTGIDRGRQHEVAEITAGETGNVVPLEDLVLKDEFKEEPTARPSDRLDSMQIGRWAVAASIAIAGVISMLVWPLFGPPATQRYTTTTGEQRAFELEDGSVLYMNTRSRIEARFSPATRELWLFEGEAMFKVRREADRPFRVHTADAVIQAVGTQFNVRRDRNGTKVSVIEGKIKVLAETSERGQESWSPPVSLPAKQGRTKAPAMLTVGEEVSIAANGRIVKYIEADVEKTVAWRQRRLIFRTDTLANIAVEFNRYNRSPQIRLEGAAPAARRFSGVFDADDPESLAQVLMGHGGLAIERSDDEIVIRAQD